MGLPSAENSELHSGTGSQSPYRRAEICPFFCFHKLEQILLNCLPTPLEHLALCQREAVLLPCFSEPEGQARVKIWREKAVLFSWTEQVAADALKSVWRIVHDEVNLSPSSHWLKNQAGIHRNIHRNLEMLRMTGLKTPSQIFLHSGSVWSPLILHIYSCYNVLWLWVQSSQAELSESLTLPLFIHLPEERSLWIQQLTGNTTNDDYLYNFKVPSLPFIWEHLHFLPVSLSSAEQQPNNITHHQIPSQSSAGRDSHCAAIQNCPHDVTQLLKLNLLDNCCHKLLLQCALGMQGLLRTSGDGEVPVKHWRSGVLLRFIVNYSGTCYAKMRFCSTCGPPVDLDQESTVSRSDLLHSVLLINGKSQGIYKSKKDLTTLHSVQHSIFKQVGFQFVHFSYRLRQQTPPVPPVKSIFAQASWRLMQFRPLFSLTLIPGLYCPCLPSCKQTNKETIDSFYLCLSDTNLTAFTCVFELFLNYFSLLTHRKAAINAYLQNSKGYKTTCKSLYFLKKELRAYKVKEATLKRKQKIKHSTCFNFCVLPNYWFLEASRNLKRSKRKKGRCNCVFLLYKHYIHKQIWEKKMVCFMADFRLSSNFPLNINAVHHLATHLGFIYLSSGEAAHCFTGVKTAPEKSCASWLCISSGFQGKHPGLLAPDCISIGDGNTTGVGQSGPSQWVLFGEQVNGSDSPLPAALKLCEGLLLSPLGSALWQLLWVQSHPKGEAVKQSSQGTKKPSKPNEEESKALSVIGDVHKKQQSKLEEDYLNAKGRK
ncbi:hypothetical protein EK904_008227 [Melospiza melodia maxima]|nr:hypothetical protein EK904_008227 [Melospiza melodia maxima]